jgi:hypothetical protein
VVEEPITIPVPADPCGAHRLFVNVKLLHRVEFANNVPEEFDTC